MSHMSRLHTMEGDAMGIEAWVVSGKPLPPPQTTRPMPHKPHKSFIGDTCFPNPVAYNEWHNRKDGWGSSYWSCSFADFIRYPRNKSFDYELDPTK